MLTAVGIGGRLQFRGDERGVEFQRARVLGDGYVGDAGFFRYRYAARHGTAAAVERYAAAYRRFKVCLGEVVRRIFPEYL